MKKGKPQPLMDMLKKNSTYGTSKTKKLLQFDVMNSKINDCIEILVIITHVSLDIDSWEEGLTHEFSMRWFSCAALFINAFFADLSS